MGIKEAYNMINELEQEDFHNYVDTLYNLEAANRCKAYRKALEVIEKECPEVLEDKSENI